MASATSSLRPPIATSTSYTCVSHPMLAALEIAHGPGVASRISSGPGPGPRGRGPTPGRYYSTVRYWATRP
eukprot:750323-Hanusia_phi.AAC.1